MLMVGGDSLQLPTVTYWNDMEVSGWGKKKFKKLTYYNKNVNQIHVTTGNTISSHECRAYSRVRASHDLPSPTLLPYDMAAYQQ